MPVLTTVSRTPLPERLGSSFYAHFRHDGRRGVALAGSGELWLLEVEPERRAVRVAPLPISVPPESVDPCDSSFLTGSHALDRLLVPGPRPRVYAIPSGELVAEVEPFPGRATCMSPGGRWLVSLAESEGWTMDLAEPQPYWYPANDFNVIEEHVRTGEPPPPPGEAEVEEFYLDHVDGLVALPVADDGVETYGGERFWLAAGCYGFVLTHLAHAWGDSGTIWREPGKTRGSEGLVYDPTELVQPPGRRHVFVVHGSGAGVAAVDPATGETHHCRVHPSGKHPYSFFSNPVPCGDAAQAWVECRDGQFLWRPGQAPAAMPEPPGRVLALYPDALLCVESQDLVFAEIG